MKHCSNCGERIVEEQQFCRSCGAALAAEHPPRTFNLRFWGLLTLLMIFGGLLTAMGGKIFAVRWVSFAGLFLMMTGIFFVAAYPFLKQARPRKRRAAQLQQQPQPDSLSPDPVDTTNKLQLPIGDNDFIPSITEPTTNLLTPRVPVRSNSRE